MSFGVNKLILVGRVSNDPEFRPYSGGQIAIISVATSEKRKDNKSGQWIEETEFHNNITFFGKTADIIQQYVTKGTAVYIEGKLKTEKYTDKQGNQKEARKIMGMSLQMVGRNDDQGQGQQRQGGQRQQYNNQRQSPPQQGYNNQYQNQSQGYQNRQPPPQQNQGYQQPNQQPAGENDFYDDDIPF